MGNNADSRSKLEAAREQALAEQALNEAAKATPVRSAKDAINAMYAQDSDKRLSSYLAKSAKEIINSSANGSSDQKSAANLHQHATKRRIEMERPSASGVLRVAPAEQPAVPEDLSQAMDPLAQKTAPVVRPRIPKAPTPAAPSVIKTSLKLGPKKVPVASAPHTIKPATHGKSLNGQKGRTALSQFLTNRQIAQPAPAKANPKPQVDAETAETLRVMQQAVKQTTHQNTTISPKTVPRPKMRAPHGLMQDVIRPVAPNRPVSKPQSVKTADGLPLDSVKRRFRAAPKGFTAAPEVQPASYTTFEEPVTSKKPPVEIYGLMDEEPAPKPKDLPAIEDYQPKDADQPNGSETKSPDNNKYTLKGQSPFFLKSVNVEKRPLSGSIGSKKTPSEGTLYERPASTPVSDKNVYDRKEERKKLPTKPTVIIPASRRSRAPLIMLLILTVILGAAMGAFIYLCFFKYME